MITHPVALAYFALEAAASVLLLLAATRALRALLVEDAGLVGGAATRALRLGGFGMLAFVASSSALLGLIAYVLPDAVPGAMCGSGVLEATERAPRALGLRVGALFLLSTWFVLARLVRGADSANLHLFSSRLLLLAAPVLVLAVLDSVRALLEVDTNAPVDCCSAMLRSVRSEGTEAGASGNGATWAALVLSVALALSGALGTARRLALSRALLVAPALFAVALVFVAPRAVRDFASAFYYGSPRHDCSWCLFASEQYFVGFALAGAVLLVLCESLAPMLSGIALRSAPALDATAGARARRAHLRIALAALLFAGLAFGPALVHRLRTGEWLP